MDKVVLEEFSAAGMLTILAASRQCPHMLKGLYGSFARQLKSVTCH
jgi:hypothetical protein